MPDKSQTLHMIGNAHIDPVWLWRWPEGCHEVLATFQSALDRMDEDPDFLFISTSAAFYAWVEEMRPAMFEAIQRRVREGRWEIVGGWWIEPDCNIPSGESFARQALIGQRYFRDKFGVTARVGLSADAFGHHAMLPQILKLSGMDTYIFLRPSPQEKGLPGRLFWWESDDGSRVLTARILFEYNTWGKELDIHIRRCAAELRDPVNDLMCFYGVGNHGGGPTVENLRSIRRLADDPGLPRLQFSSPGRYFDCIAPLADALPVVHDDLQHHASGCYSVHSGIKRWNRQAEWALVTAEKWASVASVVTGLPYPGAALDQGWRSTLFNQFHDIMAGTCVESAYTDARHTYGESLAVAGRALNAAVQSLAWQTRIPVAPGTPIHVFNPHAWPSVADVEVEFGRLPVPHHIVDDQGQPVPSQRSRAEATAGGRTTFSFLADLPALGYRVYRLAPCDEADATPMAAVRDSAPGDTSTLTLENRRLRLTFDRASGDLTSLYDKDAEIEALAGPAAVPVVLDDPSDTWAHNVFSFRNVAGRFQATDARVIVHGPVKTVLRVNSEYGQSRLVQDFTLYADLDVIDVAVAVDWQEEHKVLKLRFPVNVHFHRATSEVPFGFIDRFANGEEEPGQSWLDVSGQCRDNGERYGLSVINDSKYSYDVDVRDIGLTVLRSPIYAHHDPTVPQRDEVYSFIDHGLQRFTYRLYPHRDGWEEAGTVQCAAELNRRPIVLIGTYHPDGTLPMSGSFVSVEPSNVVVTALKQAEDGDDLILRTYETTRTTTQATIRVPLLERVIETRFGPCQIKTFRIPRDPAAPVTEVNLLEDPL